MGCVGGWVGASPWVDGVVRGWGGGVGVGGRNLSLRQHETKEDKVRRGNGTEWKTKENQRGQTVVCATTVCFKMATSLPNTLLLIRKSYHSRSLELLDLLHDRALRSPANRTARLHARLKAPDITDVVSEDGVQGLDLLRRELCE